MESRPLEHSTLLSAHEPNRVTLPQLIKLLRGNQGWPGMVAQLSDLVLWLATHSLEKITCLVGH